MPAVKPLIVIGQTVRFRLRCPHLEKCRDNFIKSVHEGKLTALNLSLRFKLHSTDSGFYKFGCFSKLVFNFNGKNLLYEDFDWLVVLGLTAL